MYEANLKIHLVLHFGLSCAKNFKNNKNKVKNNPKLPKN